MGGKESPAFSRWSHRHGAGGDLVADVHSLASSRAPTDTGSVESVDLDRVPQLTGARAPTRFRAGCGGPLPRGTREGHFRGAVSSLAGAFCGRTFTFAGG